MFEDVDFCENVRYVWNRSEFLVYMVFQYQKSKNKEKFFLTTFDGNRGTQSLSKKQNLSSSGRSDSS